MKLYTIIQKQYYDTFSGLEMITLESGIQRGSNNQGVWKSSEIK